MRGGRSAEKRSGACEAPVGPALGASQDARERAYDAGRSPLGAPPWRLSPPLIPAKAGIQVLGPRFRGDERKEADATPRSAFRLEHALNERGCGCSSTTAIRSQ